MEKTNKINENQGHFVDDWINRFSTKMNQNEEDSKKKTSTSGDCKQLHHHHYFNNFNIISKS